MVKVGVLHWRGKPLIILYPVVLERTPCKGKSRSHGDSVSRCSSLHKYLDLTHQLLSDGFPTEHRMQHASRRDRQPSYLLHIVVTGPSNFTRQTWPPLVQHLFFWTPLLQVALIPCGHRKNRLGSAGSHTKCFTSCQPQADLQSVSCKNVRRPSERPFSHDRARQGLQQATVRLHDLRVLHVSEGLPRCPEALVVVQVERHVLEAKEIATPLPQHRELLQTVVPIHGQNHGGTACLRMQPTPKLQLEFPAPLPSPSSFLLSPHLATRHRSSSSSLVPRARLHEIVCSVVKCCLFLLQYISFSLRLSSSLYISLCVFSFVPVWSRFLLPPHQIGERPNLLLSAAPI